MPPQRESPENPQEPTWTQDRLALQLATAAEVAGLAAWYAGKPPAGKAVTGSELREAAIHPQADSALRDLLDGIVQRIVGLFGYSQASIYLVDGTGTELALAAVSKRSDRSDGAAAGAALPYIVGWVAAIHHARIIGETTSLSAATSAATATASASSEQQHGDSIAGAGGQTGSGSEAALPIEVRVPPAFERRAGAARAGEHLLGVLHVESPIPHGFTPADMAFLQTLANQLAGSILSVATAAAALSAATTTTDFHSPQIQTAASTPQLSGLEADSDAPQPAIGISKRSDPERSDDDAADRRQMERTIHELQVLMTTSQAIAAETDLNAIYREIHRAVNDLVGGGAEGVAPGEAGWVDFFIAIYEPTAPPAVAIHIPYLWEGRSLLSVDPFPLGEGLTSVLIRTGQPLLIAENTEIHARRLGAKFVGSKPAKSWLGVPLRAGGETIGAIVVQDVEHERRFTTEDQRLLETLAAQVAATIRNNQALERIRLQAERDQLLHQATRNIRSSVDMQTILATATAELGKALGARRARILIAPPESAASDAESAALDPESAGPISAVTTAAPAQNEHQGG